MCRLNWRFDKIKERKDGINSDSLFFRGAGTKHMTNSAKNLHISQPGLSQAIYRLEESLGVPLFASKGRNIVLTEYGHYF